MPDNKNSKIIPFVFDENLVRTIVDEAGNFWFVAKDVCRVLAIENNRDAIAGLDEDEKITVANPDGNPRAGVPHSYTMISESGLYALVFRSRKKEARAFSKWVRAEVLPTLRKTGSYTMPGAEHGGVSSSSRYPLPDVPEMYHLRPAMRQRLWQDALQTARLDNAGSDVAAQWFATLCRMMAAGHAPRGGVDETTRRILQFADERCRAEHNGRVSAAALYEAFTLWWCSHFDDPVPSQHIFGRVMSWRYIQSKRGGKSCYFGLRLAA